jgi:hypothetical protein
MPGEVLEYGLGFGDGTECSVDLPGSCVLTTSTYQTLRDYRFSFAKAERSAAIFDEAQNIKNSNALERTPLRVAASAAIKKAGVLNEIEQVHFPSRGFKTDDAPPAFRASLSRVGGTH